MNIITAPQAYLQVGLAAGAVMIFTRSAGAVMIFTRSRKAAMGDNSIYIPPNTFSPIEERVLNKIKYYRGHRIL